MTKFITLILILLSSSAMAGEADVLFVELTKSMGGAYYIDTTVKHADTGWDHYANWWRVSTGDGKELSRRALAHPHVNEQPFTRGQSNVRIPKGVNVIVVEAHDLVHKYGGKTIKVDIGKPDGPGYKIIK